jgi:sec-independent protein translocase protein TatA
MIGDLFDSPWKILIVAVVLIVLFGSTKLPAAARSLGRSMRILKSEVQGMHSDDADAEPEPAPLARAAAQPAAQPQITAAQQQTPQQQIDDLQRQLSELKGASAGDQRAQQPS